MKPLRSSCRRVVPVAFGAVSLASAGSAHAQDFSFEPPGQLVPGSGEGRVDFTVYAPGMRFPIQDAPAFANSQVWGVGGSQGPAGSSCSAPNFSYPWHDNYCETRQWDMPLCPAGTGHQGQDIRGATCDKNVHPAVAAVDGTITNVGTYSVYLTAADGTRYDYLHMGNVQVAFGDDVKQGDLLGYVSNEFGGTPTTVHLHFNLRQVVDGFGSVYVPPYMSLVEAYQALVGPVVPPLPTGALETISCDGGALGWVFDAAAPLEAASVRLAFGGELGAPGVRVATTRADLERSDLCATLGSCDHGFEALLPYSLYDASPHEVRAYAALLTADANEELEGSPAAMECEPPAVQGFKRKIAGGATMMAWALDPFFDAPPAPSAEPSGSVADALARGPDLGAEPTIRKDGASYWLIDAGTRRALGPSAIRGFRLGDALAAAPALDPSEFPLPEGPAVRSRPLLVRDSAGAYWLVDDLPDAGGQGGSGGNAAPAESAGCSCGITPRPGPSSVGLGSLLAAWLVRRRTRRAAWRGARCGQARARV
jgi:uncharacterized protein (TIGR03382 family)